MTTKKKSYFEKLEKTYGALTFGEMLSSWRKSEKKTQATFARKIGLSAQNLNDLEKGRRIPTATRAAKIAQKLGLPVKGMIQLAVRDSLAKEGFKFDVKLEDAS